MMLVTSKVLVMMSDRNGNVDEDSDSDCYDGVMITPVVSLVWLG